MGTLAIQSCAYLEKESLMTPSGVPNSFELDFPVHRVQGIRRLWIYYRLLGNYAEMGLMRSLRVRVTWAQIAKVTRWTTFLVKSHLTGHVE